MNYRRYYTPNATVFITQVVFQREPFFADEERLAELLTIIRNVKEFRPFIMLGYVFLPDHFHLLIRLTGESNFSQIMHSIKSYYSQQHRKRLGVSGRLQVWQRRFHDHIIRDERDFASHLDYIHYNPVRHGLVTRPEDWPHSSFQYWKVRGAYPNQWGWNLPDSLRGMEGRE